MFIFREFILPIRENIQTPRLLVYVLYRAVDYGSHVVIGDAVDYILPLSFRPDEVVAAEHFQLIGYGGLSHTEMLSDMRAAHRSALKKQEYTQARRVSEYLEEVGY